MSEIEGEREGERREGEIGGKKGGGEILRYYCDMTKCPERAKFNDSVCFEFEKAQSESMSFNTMFSNNTQYLNIKKKAEVVLVVVTVLTTRSSTPIVVVVFVLNHTCLN